MIQAAILSVLRSVLISAGTYAAAKGLIDAGQVEQIVGAAVVLLAAAWGAVEKLRS